MSKDILRNKILKIRKKKYQQKEINYKFLKKILRINNISSKSIIGCYYPINSEIDTRPLISYLITISPVSALSLDNVDP